MATPLNSKLLHIQSIILPFNSVIIQSNSQPNLRCCLPFLVVLLQVATVKKNRVIGESASIIQVVKVRAAK